MFKEKANTLFNNILFMSDSLPRMHETMNRLYEEAKRLADIEGQSNLARYLDQSPQTIKNWEDRGVSKSGISAAVNKFGADASYITTGKRVTSQRGNSTNKNYPRVVGTAHMGDKGYYLDLDGGDGYLEFEAEEGAIAIHVRGDSMFPAIRDGWYIVIEPSHRPTLGEYVLLKFSNGRNMVKELLQVKDDCYVVMSVNTGERITAMKEDLIDIKGISAIVPPSKHKDF
jgi:phage repressor protein C with HTH and peptisase S24 domain